ncbi:MAG TPA: PD-(D/E)XK nuclease family protein, partial [Polyangiaceae bacterium]|nr:PD-(D/E)XK nuclease family protein [Polyangiaceae bacterium]
MNIRVSAGTLVPYLSASQLAGYLRCPKQYWFRYIAKKTPSHVGVALPFGRAWGNVIAHYLKNSEPGHLVPLPELAEYFREDFERELADAQAPVLFDEEETAASLIETAERMLQVFQEKVPLPEAVLGVEMAFSVSLAHPEEPDDPLPVPLVGAIDVLV